MILLVGINSFPRSSHNHSVFSACCPHPTAHRSDVLASQCSTELSSVFDMENDTFSLATEKCVKLSKTDTKIYYYKNPTIVTNLRLLFLRPTTISFHRRVFQHWIEVWDFIWSPSQKQFWNPCPRSQCQWGVPKCSHEKRAGSVLTMVLTVCLLWPWILGQKQICFTEWFH